MDFIQVHSVDGEIYHVNVAQIAYLGTSPESSKGTYISLAGTSLFVRETATEIMELCGCAVFYKKKDEEDSPQNAIDLKLTPFGKAFKEAINLQAKLKEDQDEQ